jgi:hypothetical protein
VEIRVGPIGTSIASPEAVPDDTTTMPAPSEPAKGTRQPLVLLVACGVIVGIATGLLLISRSGVGTFELRGQSPSRAPATAPRIETAASDQRVVEADIAPAWVGRRKAAWARDGSKTIAFELSALRDVGPATRERPSLVVRCLSGRTEVFLSLGTAASIERNSDRHTVRLQIDGEGPSEQQWLDSESSAELFAPDGVALARRLAQARTLRFGFTPYNSQPVVAEFNVAGFDELAGLVASTCHWRAGDQPRRAAR